MAVEVLDRVLEQRHGVPPPRGGLELPRACAPRLVLALAEQRESPVAPRHAAEAELGARKLARRALRARAAHHLLQQHVAPARRRRPGVPAVLPPAPNGGSRVAPAPLRPRGARRGARGAWLSAGGPGDCSLGFGCLGEGCTDLGLDPPDGRGGVVAPGMQAGPRAARVAADRDTLCRWQPVQHRWTRPLRRVQRQHLPPHTARLNCCSARAPGRGARGAPRRRWRSGRGGRIARTRRRAPRPAGAFRPATRGTTSPSSPARSGPRRPPPLSISRTRHRRRGGAGRGLVLGGGRGRVEAEEHKLGARVVRQQRLVVRIPQQILFAPTRQIPLRRSVPRRARGGGRGRRGGGGGAGPERCGPALCPLQCWTGGRAGAEASGTIQGAWGLAGPGTDGRSRPRSSCAQRAARRAKSAPAAGRKQLLLGGRGRREGGGRTWI